MNLADKAILVNAHQPSFMTELSQSTGSVTLEPKHITDVNAQYESEVRAFRESKRRELLKGLSGRDSSLSGKKRRMNWEPKTSLDTAFWDALDDNLLQVDASASNREQDITDEHARNAGGKGNENVGGGDQEMKNGLT